MWVDFVLPNSADRDEMPPYALQTIKQSCDLDLGRQTLSPTNGVLYFTTAGTAMN